MKVPRYGLLAAAVLLVAAVGTTAAGGPLEDHNLRQPLDANVWVSCANGGAGEYVHLTGMLHVLIQANEDATGGLHVKDHFQPMGVGGVGLTTGDRYRATGVTQSQVSSRPPGYPYVFTFVNNFRVLGPGPGNNFLVHLVQHITINANDEITVEFERYSSVCK